MQCELPPIKDVVELLTSLMGRPVTAVKAAAPYRPSKSDVVYVGIYRTAEGSLAALCIADLAFSAHSAAALAMLPVARAEEAARARKLDEQSAENLHEIMNVISTLVTKTDFRPRLDSVVGGISALPQDAAELLAKPRARSDIDVTIAGYAKGKLSLLGL